MKRYRIKVIPRSSKNQIFEVASDELKVKLTAPPIEGKANEALIEILSDYLKVKKTSLRIVSGNTARNKIVEVS
jgi:uncharacterized protein (TIGR00251 family)